MTDFSEYVPLFVTPTTEVDPSITDEAIHALTYAYLKMVRIRIERQSLSISSSVESYRITEAPLSSLPSRHAWRPECSLAHLFLHRGHAEQAILQISLAYAALGQEVEVATHLDARVRLLFEGHLFECIGSTRIQAANGSIEIQTDNGVRRIGFLYRYDQWILNIPILERALINWVPIQEADVPPSPYVIYSSQPMGDHSNFHWPKDDEDIPTLFIDRNTEEKPKAYEIRQLQAVIQQYAKSYASWTQRLLAGFFLFAEKGNSLLKSQSNPVTIGLIYLERCPDPIRSAELLVHETAHQHFFLCNTLTPLTNTNDPELYYSPLKRRNRPIDKLLLAAHATLNMLMYYQELMRSKTDLTQTLPVVTGYQQDLKHMFGSLKKSCGLTREGTFFVEHMLCAYESLPLLKAV